MTGTSAGSSTRWSASSTRASGVSISTDLTVSRSVAAANNADSAFEHVLSVLDGSEETLEANIIDAAGRRRRLGMADISVESISASTFAPSAAPTPTPKPTSAALTAAPTAAPIAATTTTTKKDGDGGGADLTVIIIVIVVGVVVVICCVVGALLVVVGVVVVKSQNTEGAQKPARPAAPEEQKTLAHSLDEISLEEAKPNAHFSL